MFWCVVGIESTQYRGWYRCSDGTIHYWIHIYTLWVHYTREYSKCLKIECCGERGWSAKQGSKQNSSSYSSQPKNGLYRSRKV